MIKNYTVEEVNDLFADTVTSIFAVTPEGQAHLNRIAKAITNESLLKRQTSQHDTLANKAFTKALEKVAASKPEDVTSFLSGKAAWKARYIAKHYTDDEE